MYVVVLCGVRHERSGVAVWQIVFFFPDWCWNLKSVLPNQTLFFFPLPRSKGTGLFYWAASRHRLFLYWPVSRCACGREGISPDLPLPGWEATARHSWAGEGEEVAEGW